MNPQEDKELGNAIQVLEESHPNEMAIIWKYFESLIQERDKLLEDCRTLCAENSDYRMGRKKALT